MGIKHISAVVALVLGLGGLFVYFSKESVPKEISTLVSDGTTTTESAEGETLSLPIQKMLEGGDHVWQTFNNCSSTGLLIAMSFFGIHDTQEAIAEATRPWNNLKGDNDDKSVTLFELANYAKEKHGLVTYVRADGDIELLKKFIANDIPVVARALMYPDKDYVHYRVIKGYDESKKIVIESDSIEGKTVPYTYDAWMHLWKDFNYSYLIVVPESKKALVEEILGENLDETLVWKKAKLQAESDLAKNPNDTRAHFNLVTALYYVGDYEGTVREFEKIEGSLQPHVLWFQHEPIQAYFKLGKYDRVVELADKVINANNKAVSELYVLKGKVYQVRGDTVSARAEFQKAMYYNKHLKEAQEAYKSSGGE